jgi:tRNA-modifying protein YgfZ
MSIQSLARWHRHPRYQALWFRGADARAFLQSQLTQQLDDLRPNTPKWAAWLNPKGRVLALLLLVDREQDGLVAITHSGRVEAVRSGLQRFVLRSKVVIDPATDVAVHLLNDALSDVPAADAQWGRFCFRFDTALLPPIEAVQALAWQRALIDARIAEIEPGGEDRFLPQPLGLDALGALSFKKGCYPGQEVVARLHFLGKSKRELIALCGSGAQAPAPGATLHGSADFSDDAVGDIVHAVNDQGTVHALAVVKTERNFPLWARSAATGLHVCLNAA